MSRDQADDAGTFTRATRLLRQTTLTADEANQLIEIIEEMSNTSAENTVARLEAKFDARFDAQDTKLDAQNTKYNVLIWAIGFAGVVISLAIIFGR